MWWWLCERAALIYFFIAASFGHHSCAVTGSHRSSSSLELFLSDSHSKCVSPLLLIPFTSSIRLCPSAYAAWAFPTKSPLLPFWLFSLIKSNPRVFIGPLTLSQHQKAKRTLAHACLSIERKKRRIHSRIMWKNIPLGKHARMTAIKSFLLY